MAKLRTRKPKTTPPLAAAATPAIDVAPGDIARRAYALYIARGGEHGRDLEDWFRAEQELKSQPASLHA